LDRRAIRLDEIGVVGGRVGIIVEAAMVFVRARI
jgi:hypothetical protein